MVKEVSDQNFREIVLESDIPVVVDFWAPWCGPCHMVSPIIDKLSEDYAEKFGFCKMNVDVTPKTAQNYGITSIPTLMFFKEGQKVNEIIGAVPETMIKSIIDKLI